MATATRVCAALALFLLACGTGPAPAGASSVSLSPMSSGTVSFDVNGVSNSMAAGSQSYSFSLSVTTDTLKGSITLAGPLVLGTLGNYIPIDAFQATCVATHDPSGIFTSSGTVRMSAFPVTCATLAARESNRTVQFSVTLYLDESADAYSFTADTYSNGLLVVTANAP